MEEQPVELSIADLQNIRTIIDLASKRGAFGANEMSAVGTTYDRLNKFLNGIAAQQSSSDNAAQQPTT
jgi:hypothetical protein